MCRSKKNFIGCLNDLPRFSHGVLRSFWSVYMCRLLTACLPKILESWQEAIINCFHESGNVLDPFPKKVYEHTDEQLVGHFPTEISKVRLLLKYSVQHLSK